MSLTATPEAPVKTLSVAELRVRLSPLAQRLSRLSSVADLFGRLVEAESGEPVNLLRPFDQARVSVRQFQLLLEQGETQTATHLLSTLSQELSSLEQLVAAVGRQIPSSTLERYLAGDDDLPPELLARLLEVYASSRAKDESTRRKLKLVALSLARAERADLNGFSQALERHHILLPVECSALPSAEATRAAELQRRAGQLMPGPTPELTALEAELRAFEAELGELLYTAAGLGEVVGLELALEHRKSHHETAPMTAYEDPVIVIDEQPDADPSTGEELEQDAPAALELLRQLEKELASTASESQQPSHTGFHMETAEMRAIGSELDSSQSGSVVLRAAACRAALERLAEREAGQGALADELLDGMGQAEARTIVRRALAIEAELQERVQEALTSGRTEQAKTATSSLHQLSSARLGLSLEADPPPTVATQQTRPARGAAAPSGASQADLEQALAEAQLIKEALQEQKKPPTERRTRVRRSRPVGFDANPGIPRQKVLVALLGLLVAVSVVINSGRWVLAPEGPEVSADDFRHVAPLKSADPMRGALLLTAEPEWDDNGEPELRRRAQELWNEARVEGYDSLVLMDSSGKHPLAYAAYGHLTVVPRSPTAP